MHFVESFKVLFWAHPAKTMKNQVGAIAKKSVSTLKSDMFHILYMVFVGFQTMFQRIQEVVFSLNFRILGKQKQKTNLSK